MKRKPPPDPILLKKYYVYGQHSGLFWHRLKRQKCRVGKVAGLRRRDGYVSISINGKTWQAHHLAWFYVYGTWPDELDHKDRNRSNNSLRNLRDATRSQNNGNSNGWGKKKRSGLPRGVYHLRSKYTLKKYRAQIVVHRKIIHLGCFWTVEEAEVVYREAAKAHFGEFSK